MLSTALTPALAPQIISGRNIAQNTWVTQLSAAQAASLGTEDPMPGLRINTRRAIRAKYPNGNPELSGEWFISSNPAMGRGEYVKGWVTTPTKWVPPMSYPKATDVVATAADWPSVDWPMSEEGGSPWTGEGDWGEYHMGMGGTCANSVPPFGYWCSSDPPRAALTHQSPSGVVWDGVLPNAPYAQPKGAVVQAWRGDNGRWFTWQFLVDGVDNATQSLQFSQAVGGNQGGEGTADATEWWIENGACCGWCSAIGLVC